MRTLTVSVLLCAMTATCLAGSLKSEILDMNAKINKAIMKKDIKTFEKLVRSGITKDFKYVENGQSQSFDEMISNMKQGMAMTKKVTDSTTKLISLKENGNTAVAIMSHSMTNIVIGEDKKDHTMVFSGKTKDTFKKVNGKWLMASMEWTNMKATMDGKPFDMSKMAPASK